MVERSVMWMCKLQIWLPFSSYIVLEAEIIDYDGIHAQVNVSELYLNMSPISLNCFYILLDIFLYTNCIHTDIEKTFF